MLPALLALGALAGSALAAVDWLPGQRMVPMLPADPHETANTLTFRGGAPPLQGVVGDTAGLVRVELGDVALQADLGAAIFLGFLPGDGFTFGIQTIDGLLRVPVSLLVGHLTTSLEWVHISAHYADGVRYGDALPSNTAGYSRELLRALATWQAGAVAPYLGVRALTHSIPAAPSLGVQAGARAAGERQTTWFAAVDLAWNAEHGWSTEASVETGLLLRSQRARALRFGLTAHRGPALAGKLAGVADPYLGGVLAFDWHGGWE